MPRYVYRCQKCENIFYATHSIKDKLTDCQECKLTGSLERLPTNFNIKSNNIQEKHKVGDIVKSSIEDIKEELKEEKKRLKTTEHK